MRPFTPLAALLAGMLAGTLQAASPAPTQLFAYFGTYTGANSRGIYVARFDSNSGKLGPLSLAAELTNPSYIAPHPNGRFLYAVSEVSQTEGRNGGSVSAFSIDRKSGKLTFVNRVASGGSGPCYARVDRTGRAVLVANYGSGSFAVLPIEADGRLREASTVIQDRGKGTNPNRQEGPHAHSLNPSPDNRFAVGADLGLDKLFLFRLDSAKGTLTANDPPFWEAKPGSGPRHFAFHPSRPFAYVTNEMASTVIAFGYDAEHGALRELQTVSTLPVGFNGENTTADVQVDPSGRFLFDSNRGADTIAVFRIDEHHGTLTPVANTPTQGKVPRGFGIDPSGRFLVAANQKSDNIVVFQIDQSTGRLTPTGQVLQIGSPVCVKFMAAGE